MNSKARKGRSRRGAMNYFARSHCVRKEILTFGDAEAAVLRQGVETVEGRLRLGPTAIIRASLALDGASIRTAPGARSSAGEHYVDIVGVTGSIPVAPTILIYPTHDLFRRPMTKAHRAIFLSVAWRPLQCVAAPRRYSAEFLFQFDVPRPISSKLSLLLGPNLWAREVADCNRLRYRLQSIRFDRGGKSHVRSRRQSARRADTLFLSFE